MNLLVLMMTFFYSTGIFATTVLFLGDSLTEGYQLAQEEAYPAIVEKEFKARGKDIKVINGGVSGATSASGLKRLDWYLKSTPDIMVLALGANDGLRGLKLIETEKNLSLVVEKAQSRKIKVILAGMKMPTNYGEDYRQQFEKLFKKISSKYKIRLIPFLLTGVAGKADLNLADGIHPNAKGHLIMAKTIMSVLEKEL